MGEKGSQEEREKAERSEGEEKKGKRCVCVGGDVKEPRNNFGQIRLIYAGLCNFMENVL